MEVLPERSYIPWRKRLWSQVEGPEVLEVGVGTGKNMPFYPADIKVTAIDLVPAMLRRARNRARELDLDVDLRKGDIQDLEFSEARFDDVVATFVFCSVPDPVLGLSEVERVLKPGGQAHFIEHVRSEGALLGTLMDWFDPIVVRMMGPHINRRTVENVRRTGLVIERVEDIGMGDIFKWIIARQEN